MNKKIIISAFIIVILIGAVLYLTVFRNGNGEIIEFEKTAIDRGDIEALVITTGTLNPVTTVDVGSQVSGKIEKIFVDFNSMVKEGQIIAQIEQPLFLTKLQQNEANFESAKASVERSRVTLENRKRQLDRAKALFDKKLISYEEKENTETQYLSAKSDLLSSEAGLARAKSQLDTSRVDLQYTIIKSPIEGVIINRNINVGQTVAASFQAPVLFQIANDLTKMQVECSIDEADIGKIKEGQDVRFTVDAFPNEEFHGKVKQVRYAPQVVQNVVTYTTIVAVDNPGMKLLPGMTATASVIVGQARNALRVPNIALRFTPNLSPEEMQKIFEDMRAQWMDRMKGKKPAMPKPSAGSRPQHSPNMGTGFMGAPSGRSGRSPFSRVWIEEEGKLRMIFIKTGVTDNSMTEIVFGELKEGQEVITGQTGGSSRNADFRRMMRFMR